MPEISMFSVAIVAVLTAMTLAVVRALLGPTAFDRLLAVNSIGTFAIMLLALFGFLTERPEFLDLGITYALLNMIGTLAVLKFFKYGSLAYDHREGDTEGKG